MTTPHAGGVTPNAGSSPAPAPIDGAAVQKPPAAPGAPSDSAGGQQQSTAAASSSTANAKCSKCGKTQAALRQQNLRLKPCPCRKAQYCNTDCQKEDWKRHKSECTYRTKQPRPATGAASTSAAAGSNGAPKPAAGAAPHAAPSAAPGHKSPSVHPTPPQQQQQPAGSAVQPTPAQQPPQQQAQQPPQQQPQPQPQQQQPPPQQQQAQQQQQQQPPPQQQQQQQQPAQQQRFPMKPVSAGQPSSQAQRIGVGSNGARLGAEAQSIVERGNLVQIRALVLQAAQDVPGASEIIEAWMRRQQGPPGAGGAGGLAGATAGGGGASGGGNNVAAVAAAAAAAAAGNPAGAAGAAGGAAGAQPQLFGMNPQLLPPGLSPGTIAGNHPMFPQQMLYQANVNLGMQPSPLMMPGAALSFMPAGLGLAGGANVPNLTNMGQGMQGVNLQASPFLATAGGVISPINPGITHGGR